MHKITELLNSGIINLSGIAKQMYPGNKQPGQYLSKKLRGVERQSFTPDDRKKVENILKKYLQD